MGEIFRAAPFAFSQAYKPSCFVLIQLRDYKKLFKMQILIIFYTFIVNGCILLLVLFTDISQLGVGNNQYLLDLIRNHNGEY